MDLTNEFRVGVPVERAWEVLTDVERIAPCMPGAQLQEIEGDEYRGIVKVKVGPITAQYKGAARFVEQDEAGRRAVLRAEGRETRGQGNANATITAQLEPDGDGTKISVMTDLTITGRVAQFGRGVLADVSTKLLGQFADCLQTKLLAGDESGATAGHDGGEAGSASGGAGGGGGSSASAPSASAAGGPRDIASEGAAATLQDVPQGASWPGQAASSGPTATTAEAATASTWRRRPCPRQRHVRPVDPSGRLSGTRARRPARGRRRPGRQAAGTRGHRAHDPLAAQPLPAPPAPPLSA